MSSDIKVILGLGTVLLLILLQWDVTHGEEVNGDDLHGDPTSNKTKSNDGIDYTKPEPTLGEFCAGIACKDKPTAGDCVKRNATTLSATNVYGAQKICCSVWVCTHENKTTTLHYGMTGMKVVKKNLPKNHTSAADKAKAVTDSTNKTCSNIVCLQGQPSPNCRKSTPSSMKTLMKVHEDCCPLWTCTFASNGSMYYIHSGMWQFSSFWETTKFSGDDDATLPVTETPVILDESVNSTNVTYMTTSFNTQVIEETDIVIDSSWGTKLVDISKTPSATCPRVNCMPSESDLKCSAVKSGSTSSSSYAKLLGLDSDCCPIYRCTGKSKVFLISFGMQTVEIPPKTQTGIPTESPPTTLSPIEKSTVLPKILTTTPATAAKTTNKPQANKASTPASTSSSPSTPKTKVQGRSLSNTTSKPDAAASSASTQTPISKSTTKSTTLSSVTKPSASVTDKPDKVQATTLKPEETPAITTTQKPSKDAKKVTTTATPKINVTPKGRSMGMPASVDTIAKPGEPAKPKDPTLPGGVPDTAADGDSPTLQNAPITTIVTSSKVNKPQCKNMKCFPAPSKDKCVESNITDCELVNLLGSALDCCPAYKCSSPTGGSMQFGITDGVSESLISSPIDEDEPSPATCEDDAVETESSTLAPKDAAKNNGSELKPFLIFEVNEEPTIITMKLEIRYVKSCSGTVCFPPSGVDMKTCKKLPKETIPKQMKELGVKTACCSVWKCTKKTVVTTQYGVSHHPSFSIPFEYSGDDTEKLPKTLTVKDAEPPMASATCPGVICSPPLQNAECKIADPSALKLSKGSLRQSQKCCPIWTCIRKDGTSVTMYGRTCPSIYSKKKLKSILQPPSNETKVFSYDFTKKLKPRKPKTKKPKTKKPKTNNKKPSKNLRTSTPPTFVFVDNPEFTEIEITNDENDEAPPAAQIEQPPPNPVPPQGQVNPMMAGVMQMQNQQMAQMNAMQQNNFENMNRMQQMNAAQMGQPQGMNNFGGGMNQHMEMDGMSMNMNMPGYGAGMPSQSLQMPGMTMYQSG